MNVSGFRVGHSAYTGTNAMQLHSNYSSALGDLMSRGVPMKIAHAKLKEALTGRLACASLKAGSVVEVVAIPVEQARPKLVRKTR